MRPSSFLGAKFPSLVWMLVGGGASFSVRRQNVAALQFRIEAPIDEVVLLWAGWRFRGTFWLT